MAAATCNNGPGAMQTRVPDRLAVTLADAMHSGSGPAELLKLLVRTGLDRLPLPGAGRTLERWQCLARVASHDLSLAKLYEGHTDALAIMQELGARATVPAGSSWGMWAAEDSGTRVLATPAAGGAVELQGVKSWCSGASCLSHALLTAWHADGAGPCLVAVQMRQSGIRVDESRWHAVGMAATGSFDVFFDAAEGTAVGNVGDYLARPGFWHGGAGIAACWHGGATLLAHQLRQATLSSRDRQLPLRDAALGRVDVALQETASLLRAAAGWIDAHPRADARPWALRVRLSAEETAACVLKETGRALGATPFCQDHRFAQAAADLPVFLRQSHADRDLAALGQIMLEEQDPWNL